MTLKIGIPIKPHIKQFVLHKEGISANEPFDLGSGGDIAIFLRGLLQGKLQAERFPQEPVESKYSETLLIAIPRWLVGRGKVIISYEGVRLANEFLMASFKEYLLLRILIAHEHGKTENETILELMREMGIEDMISFDAIQKASYRKRTQKKIPSLR